MISNYQPYFMKDVRESSARERFKVISTFAGGGGGATAGRRGPAWVWSSMRRWPVSVT